MKEDLVEWIKSKLNTGEVVEIIYLGGSLPGSKKMLFSKNLRQGRKKLDA